MKYYSDDKSIYYPNSIVPINDFGIKDLDEIEELETQLFIRTYDHFHTQLSADTIFDEKYLKSIHGYAFSKLYKWRVNIGL